MRFSSRSYVIHDPSAGIASIAHPSAKRAGFVTMIEMKRRRWATATLTTTV
jgi:hypothetical protein